uniref:Uncharacterized protein n=1 Tax=Trichobilharzia regenti TaxID=157069 RepID=A0AA85K0H5_TRIRE|nr:unnamed protein product [Trichobilharzia regenti]
MENFVRNRPDSGETNHVLIKSPLYGSSLNKAWNGSHISTSLNFIDFEKAFSRQRRSRGDLATTSLLRDPIDNYTPHSTVIRQCCMPSNPQRETYGSLRSEDGSEARLSTITNDLPDCN